MAISIGIIGCGTHAQHHSHNLGDNFVAIGVWDTDPNAMKLMPWRHFATLEALLADRTIEAVLIASPDEFHLTQIEMAIEAGKHVFCEKPLMTPADQLARFEAVFDFAERKKLVITSCHPRRYDRPILWLRDRVCPESDNPGFPKRFGKVLSFDFDFSYHTPGTSWKHGRSLLLDHINHEVDLMNALFGIEGFDAWKLHDSFDHYDVVGKRDDGVTFHFRGTRRLKTETYPEWCVVRFERGEVKVDMMMGIAYVLDHDNGTTELVPKLAIDYEGRLRKVMKDFASTISDGTPGYLSRAEMRMNTLAGIMLQGEGVTRVDT